MKKKKQKKNANSIIYKWLNDQNPVGVCGKSCTNEKKIKIREVDSIEEALKSVK